MTVTLVTGNPPYSILSFDSVISWVIGVGLLVGIAALYFIGYGLTYLKLVTIA